MPRLLVALVALVALPSGAHAQALLDLNPGAPGSSPSGSGLTEPEAQLFFSATTEATGAELWATDGTPDGTRFVTDLTPGAEGGAPSQFGRVAGGTVFAARSGLWVTDGTAAGTTQLVSEQASPAGVVGGFYYARTLSRRLVRTDGTAVEEIATDVPGIVVGVTATHVFTSELVFTGGGYNEVFAIDLATGTITPVLGPAEPGWSALLVAGVDQFATAHGRLYFAAFQSDGSVSNGDLYVWSSDGTVAGTARAFDVLWPSGPDNVNNNVELVAIGENLYIETREDGLWHKGSAGAAATQLSPSGVFSVAPWGERALVSRVTDETVELAVVDGTTQTPLGPGVAVSGLQAVDADRAFFTGRGGPGARALWYTDGTTAGTFPVVTAAGDDRMVGLPDLVGVAGGRALFAAEAERDGTAVGDELWIGPSPETVVRLEIVPDPGPVDYDGGPTGADVTLFEVPVNPIHAGGIVHYGGSFGPSPFAGSVGDAISQWTLTLPGLTVGAASAFRVRLDALADRPLPADPTTLRLLFQPLAEGVPPAPVELATAYEAGSNTVSATGFTESGHFTLVAPGVVASAPDAEAAVRSLRVAPNPVRGGATLSVDLAVPADVRVSVYDVLGRRVAVVHGGTLAAGVTALSLDARALPAGVYVARLETEGAVRSTRLTVVR